MGRKSSDPRRDGFHKYCLLRKRVGKGGRIDALVRGDSVYGQTDSMGGTRTIKGRGNFIVKQMGHCVGGGGELCKEERLIEKQGPGISQG